jgi:hypothetical protein
LRNASGLLLAAGRCIEQRPKQPGRRCTWLIARRRSMRRPPARSPRRARRPSAPSWWAPVLLGLQAAVVP